MKYEGLSAFLNLDYPCDLLATDGKGYPSLLHALAALGQDEATKAFIANGNYSVEEVRALWEKLPHKWDIIFIDQIINLFIQKYNVLTSELISYSPSKIVYSKEEDPLQIFGLITEMVRNGKKATEIIDMLNLEY